MPLAETIPGGARPLAGRSGGGSANEVALGLKELHPEQVRATVVPLYATLDGTTQTGYDTYRVPTTHDFVIEQIRPHLVLLSLTNEGGAAVANTPSSEIVAGKILLQGYRDRLAMKANNALLDLKNTDREQKIIDNHSMSLGTLHEAAGGQIIDFGATPQKVLAGESIRLDVRFADAVVAAALAGSTQYGIVLVGKLIRVAKS